MTRSITTNDKLAAIRDAGYRVSVSHKRSCRKKVGMISMATLYQSGYLTVHEARADGWEIERNGGYTTVSVFIVTDPSTRTIATGRADCSMLDRFEKQVGLKVAIDRAIASAPELRAVIAKMVKEMEERG